MGVMRRNLFLSIALLAFLSAPCMADVTVEQTTDAEYLINSGFSQAAAEDVFVQKSRATGQAIEPLYEKSSNKLVRAWRKFYGYVDPAQDTFDRLHHDIKLAPDASDL